MSDTPKTDEKVAAMSTMGVAGVVMAEFTRGLERELATEKAKAAAALSIAEDAMKSPLKYAYCAYCHRKFDEGEISIGAVEAHLQRCEKRPEAELIKKLGDALAQLAEEKKWAQECQTAVMEARFEIEKLDGQLAEANRRLEVETKALMFYYELGNHPTAEEALREIGAVS